MTRSVTGKRGVLPGMWMGALRSRHRIGAHASCARVPQREVGLGGRRCELSIVARSEEHTSELQSRPHLVCRLLLEKKKGEKSRGMPDPHTSAWCVSSCYVPSTDALAGALAALLSARARAPRQSCAPSAAAGAQRLS